MHTHALTSARWSALAGGIVVLLSLWISLGFAQKRGWELEDGFRAKEPRDLVLSPDGTRLFYVLGETDLAQNRYVSAIYAMPAAGGTPQRLSDQQGSVSSLRLSPDGTHLAYFGSREGGTGLWVMKADGTSKLFLATVEQSNSWLGETGNALCWSPDGKRLAYAAAGPRHYTNNPTPQDPPNGNDVMFIDRMQYKAAYYYGDMRRTYIWTIDAEGGAPRQITSGECDYHSISWSPDGKSIACIANRTGRDDYNSNNDICLVPVEGGEVVQLTHTIGPEYHPLFSPDGSKIAYLGRVRDHRSKESDAEFMKPSMIPARGGIAIDVSSSLDRWCAALRWSADSRTLYCTAQERGRVTLTSMSVDERRVVPLINAPGQVRSYTIGPKGDLYYVFADGTQPGEIFRARADGSNPKQLSALNAGWIDQVDIIPPQEFSFRSFDGKDVYGYLIPPHGFMQTRRYPVVLDIHGGPHGQYTYTITPRLQYYASHGYGVVCINPRGSTGRDQGFSDLCVGDLGGGDYRDLMAGMDHLLHTVAWIDSNRLGVTGVSYGGYLTNWVTTHTNRFKAAVPISSISNLISMWGTGCNTDWFESDMGFMPIDDFERAWAVSPLKYVRKCTTPTLFVHGAWDFVTTLYQAEEMFTALKKMGVDAAIAAYPNEGHGVRNQPKHTADYYHRSLDWFDKYLK